MREERKSGENQNFFITYFALVLVVICGFLWRLLRKAQRNAYIRSFSLPPGLYEKLILRHPHLTLKDCQLVGKGLRQFFLAYHNGGYRSVSMPSQVADDLWHDFILYTRHYQLFCDQAFGRFLHHSPAAVLSSKKDSNEGLRRCWVQVCKEELIDPRQPTRLPLLFALDSKLAITDGFHYTTDCSGLKRNDKDGTADSGAVVYCGGDFSSSSIDGGTSGFDGGDGGDGGGCGGGD